MSPSSIQHQLFSAIHTSCIWEATARKLGNVHRHADFIDLSLLDFLTSAGSLALSMSQPSITLGMTILNAVEACSCSTRSNVNLGIILLLGPLVTTYYNFQNWDLLSQHLSMTTIADAEQVYSAIRLAHPGNMGRNDTQDISATPTVTLQEAMRLAAGYDLVAVQYINGFSEVLRFGMMSLQTIMTRPCPLEELIIRLQLSFMSAYPDSLIARKHGHAAAVDIQHRVAALSDDGGLDNRQTRQALILLDAELRRRRMNPGTIADLIAATLFVALLTGQLTVEHQHNWSYQEPWL